MKLFKHGKTECVDGSGIIFNYIQLMMSSMSWLLLSLKDQAGYARSPKVPTERPFLRNDETSSVWGRVHRKALPPQFMEPRWAKVIPHWQKCDKSPRHVFDVIQGVKKLLNHRVVILKLLSYDYDSCSEESKAQNRHRMVKVHASDLGHHQTRTLCRETTDRPRSIITVILTCTLLATMENLSF